MISVIVAEFKLAKFFEHLFVIPLTMILFYPWSSLRIILLCFAIPLSMLFVYVFSPVDKFLRISALQCHYFSIFFCMDFFFKYFFGRGRIKFCSVSSLVWRYVVVSSIDFPLFFSPRFQWHPSWIPRISRISRFHKFRKTKFTLENWKLHSFILHEFVDFHFARIEGLWHAEHCVVVFPHSPIPSISLSSCSMISYNSRISRTEWLFIRTNQWLIMNFSIHSLSSFRECTIIIEKAACF